MERLPVDSVDPDAGDIDRIVRSFRSDGIVALPTDTLIGLSCIAASAAATARLARLKGYSAPRPFVLLFDGSRHWRTKLTRPASEAAEALLARHWPGPLTVILEAADDAPAHLVGDDGGVALRFPGHVLCRRVLEALGEPIISTSVNRMGDAPRVSAEEVCAFSPEIDLVVDGESGGAVASTIVDARGETPVVLRAGSVRVDVSTDER